ncbi:3-oxoacyl-[acyl-carrier protein] reductase [Blastomyces gilchristii SLH14081]|uniref:3-oxoacyl-[acyl-carrier protein] reductase n=1 Tax=Blastomyces gilchristii (strain SLH14081) TaxID=559298 RepID=A0A179UHX8_BLAGS|nr:3-oxoacyl-[acyl-carrier protein] reductase [Blastomyces gilchristii SLH14081]OAT06082.1 3-oxoacyl-[acyl-carrier protein] reductase [Blastomyces gilchristii SLH14081]
MLSIAVITGGAGDIGRAIAAKLAESHDRVVLVDINEAKANKVTTMLNRSVETQGEQAEGSERFTSIICDITEPTQVTELARKVLSMDGEVHTIVNNAGATFSASLQQTTPEIWKRETALNIDASFLIFHAFAGSLKRTGGSVVNIASVNGLGVFGNPGYSAAKAGLIHLTRSIAVEYAKFGIRANAVAPGTVRTSVWEDRVEANPNVFEEAMQWYPLKRTVEPVDVANAVAFLSNKELASAITGVCLPVDCGLMAGPTAPARSFAQCDDF